MLKDRFYTYCKFADEKRFQAFDINEGYAVSNLIYCTMLHNDEETCAKLQELADMNKEQGLKIQLRSPNGKIVFETK